MFGGHSCLRVGWAGFVPSFAMDKFCPTQTFSHPIAKRKGPKQSDRYLSSVQFMFSVMSVACHSRVFAEAVFIGF